MAGTRGGMCVVELVEAGAFDDALDAPDERTTEGRGHDGPGRPGGGGPGTPGGRSARTPRPGPASASRRRSRVVALVVVAVVAVLALGGSVLADRREDARLRGIAGRPGVVAPLDGPVEELWRGRGWTGSDLRDVGGRLVGAVSTPYAQVDVVALDPRTGADVWRTPVAPAAVRDLWTSCVVPGAPYPTVPPGVRPVAVCVAVDETRTTEQSALGTLTYPTRARVVVVDAVDGAVLRDVPAPATSQVAALGTDAVLAHVQPDGRARMARVDARTGAERWSFTTPEPVPTDAFGQRAVVLATAGDVVALDAGATWALAGDGEVLRGWPAARSGGAGSPLDLLADGAVLARGGVAADGGSGTEVLDVATGTTWSAPGDPVGPRPDDGSLDHLVLLQDDDARTLSAHDRASGRLRWRVELPHSVPVAVLDGRVVAVDGDVVRAVDGLSGAGLWTARLERPARGAVVSDGRVVLVSGSADERGGVLTALGLDDGRARWTSAVGHALFLFAVDGRLYGWSARGLQVLGPGEPPA